MGQKPFLLLTLAAVLFVAAPLASPAFGQQALDVAASSADLPSQGLTVEIEPVRGAYALGEIVELTIRVTNFSAVDARFPEEPSVHNGWLRVFVADNEGTFREYLGPGWSLEDSVGGGGVSLEPGQVFETTTTLMFNFHPETAHLSPLYARQVEREHVVTDYVFDRAGSYRLRAVLDLGEEIGMVESNSARLKVLRPQGDDLAVWNVLRRDPELGHLLQTGKPLGNPLSERSLALAETLASLAGAVADGTRATEILASLSQYRATVEKVQARVTQ